MVVLPLKHDDPTPMYAERLFHIYVERPLHALDVHKHDICETPTRVYEDACNSAEALEDMDDVGLEGVGWQTTNCDCRREGAHICLLISGGLVIVPLLLTLVLVGQQGWLSDQRVCSGE